MAEDDETESNAREALGAIPSLQGNRGGGTGGVRRQELQRSQDHASGGISGGGGISGVGGSSAPPSNQAGRGGNGRTARAPPPSSGKRKAFFTDEEKDAIASGVEDFGPGKWKSIREGYVDILGRRTTVQIKDCYRTMLRKGEISPELGAEALRAAEIAKATPRYPRWKGFFTDEEKEAIASGVEDFGPGMWKNIREGYLDVLGERTTVQIKDCYRTMLRRGEISPDLGAEALRAAEVAKARPSRSRSTPRRRRENPRRKSTTRAAAAANAAAAADGTHAAGADQDSDASAPAPADAPAAVANAYTIPPSPASQEGGSPRRRKRFTDEEKDAIKRGVRKFGKGDWEGIREEYWDDLQDRSGVQIKDCYRTMLRHGEIEEEEEEDTSSDEEEEEEDDDEEEQPERERKRKRQAGKRRGKMGAVAARKADSAAATAPAATSSEQGDDNEEMESAQDDEGEKEEAANDEDSIHVGSKIRKIFEGQGAFEGEIVSCPSKGRPYFLVQYEDGDKEELDKGEVEECRVLFMREHGESNGTVSEEAETKEQHVSSEEDNYSDEEERYHWKNVWPRLRKEGWVAKKATGKKHRLFNYLYIPHGCDPDSSESKIGVDYFTSAEDVISYQKDQDIKKSKEKDEGEDEDQTKGSEGKGEKEEKQGGAKRGAKKSGPGRPLGSGKNPPRLRNTGRTRG